MYILHIYIYIYVNTVFVGAENLISRIQCMWCGLPLRGDRSEGIYKDLFAQLVCSSGQPADRAFIPVSMQGLASGYVLAELSGPFCS